MRAIDLAARSVKGSANKKAAKNAEKTARKTAEKAQHARQPASTVEARRAGRRRVPDRQPAARSSCGCPTSPESIGIPADEIEHAIHEQFRAYRATLPDDRRQLLERFKVVDVARKVVGVGSVGTRAFIALLQGRDQQDPLFLQVKEATASVLEDHLPKSRYHQAGRTRRARTADDAGRERHLPRLDQGRTGQPLSLLAPAARHERIRRRRRYGTGSALVLRAPLWPHAGTRPRPIRRPDRDRRVPRQEGPVRRIDHRFLRALRRSERPRLSGVHRARSAPAGCRR